MNTADLAQYIDHTLLKPEATAADVEALIAEAAELGTFSVCVSPNMLPVTVPAGRGRAVAAVGGCPSGKHESRIKAAEAAAAVEAGADEIDMVIDIAFALHHDKASLEQEIRAVREAAPAPTVLKVIIESAALDDDAIVVACQAAASAGADFVKTSTGFHPAGGASVEAVRLMSETVSGKLGVKASGGVRTREDAEAMIAAGATRLGVSGSRQVLSGGAASGGGY